MELLPFLEWFFGWVYFFAWSATFYPQVTLILKRRHAGGFSSDFMAINIVGFIAYSIFTFASYFVPAVSASYAARLHGTLPQVSFNDVVFAAHGAVMCAVLITQLLVFPPRTLPRASTTTVCALFLGAVVAGVFGAAAGRIDWYAYLQGCGGVKVLSSLVKHVPQVQLNRSRRSTVGWSHTMVLLDVVGGLFSIAQQTVRCFRIGSTAPFTANLPKSLLAIESLLFDFWFIAQHVVWYTDRTDIDRVAAVDDGDGDGDGDGIADEEGGERRRGKNEAEGSGRSDELSSLMHKAAG